MKIVTKKPNLKQLLLDEKPAGFRKPGRSIVWWLRFIPLLCGLTLTLLWIASFPFWTPAQNSSSPLDPTQLPVPITSPDWRDVLRVRIAIDIGWIYRVNVNNGGNIMEVVSYVATLTQVSPIIGLMVAIIVVLAGVVYWLDRRLTALLQDIE
jgi:hypothetical protein